MQVLQETKVTDRRIGGVSLITMVDRLASWLPIV